MISKIKSTLLLILFLPILWICLSMLTFGDWFSLYTPNPNEGRAGAILITATMLTILTGVILDINRHFNQKKGDQSSTVNRQFKVPDYIILSVVSVLAIVLAVLAAVFLI